MEEKETYNAGPKPAGLPRGRNIELAYSIIGSTMGVVREVDSLIARVLNGEDVRPWIIQSHLQSAQELCRVVSRIVADESYTNDVSF